MSNVTLLRKLTLKSCLNFGKHFDIPIYQLIDTNKKNYLRWVYFNCSAITFMDEVLEIIGIPIEFRIKKPSTNNELGKELQEIIQSNYSPLFKIIVDKKRLKYEKINRMNERRDSNKYFSKQNILNRNHGK
jgi:hypothetical protein